MTQATLIDFPCQFPVKIIGINSSSFIDEIKEITLKHFPSFKNEDLKQQPSQQNNYLALTVTIFAENKDQLDLYYLEVTKNQHIKMVL